MNYAIMLADREVIEYKGIFVIEEYPVAQGKAYLVEGDCFPCLPGKKFLPVFEVDKEFNLIPSSKDFSEDDLGYTRERLIEQEKLKLEVRRLQARRDYLNRQINALEKMRQS